MSEQVPGREARTDETVAVLGCGPAGLLAAHALALAEQPFTILSRPAKSAIGGAQFLHEDIPGITNNYPDAEVVIRAYGDADVYRDKVYGRDPVGWPPFVSFPVAGDRHQHAWSMQDAYDKLWEMYGQHITPLHLGPQTLDTLLEEFKFVVSTVPLHLVCYTATGLKPGPCQFKSVTVQVSQGQHDYLPNNTIVYDGTPDMPWARASHLFGYSFAEYGAKQRTPPGVRTVGLVKPVANSCTCWTKSNLLRVGRMGSWKKGVLVHHAFNHVWDLATGEWASANLGSSENNPPLPGFENV